MVNIIHNDDPNSEDVLAVHNGIKQANVSMFVASNARQISFYLKDDNQQTVGGVIAYTDNSSLYVDVIWVSDKLRTKHYGSKLLQLAEEEAKKSGATYCTLDTFSFQHAEPFYLKNGYKRVHEVKNQMLGHARISLRKEL